jgi:hypothetical protein
MICINAFGFGQYAADSIIDLKNPLTESSGLILVNNILITHGDSGNPPALYEIDTVTGFPSRTVYISNATNIDWEDITADFTHIYIGDFGNNQGTRQNLRIYKISLADYWTNDTVQAETINFSYANQTSFTPAPFQTNFDCEAMVWFNDSLFLFTKQWGGQGGCRVYGLPKIAGTYALPVHDSLSFPEGVVTAADMIHDALVDALVLLINANQPRLHARYNLINSKFSTGTNAENSLILPGSIQAEGLATSGRNTYYFTSEAFLGKPSVLSVLRKNPLFGISENDDGSTIKVYPNPTTGQLALDFEKPETGRLIVYAILGQAIDEIEFFDSPSINYTLPEPVGVYFLEIHFADGRREAQRVVRE